MADPFSAQFVRGIDANRTLKDALTAAVRSQSTRRRISVTDLVNPRQAFFRWTRPDIQPSPDRAQVMLAGTGFHQLFGQAVSTEEFVEQFVEYEGVVGKIDIYDDVPVELKTTGSLLDSPAAARPSYIDQLAMYCTMTGRPTGHLLIYRRERFGRDPALRAFRVEFPDLAPVRTEMLRRRDLFRDALDRGEPGDLPQCEFLGRCDYESVCRCDTAPPLTRVVPQDGCRIERETDLEATLSAQLSNNNSLERSRGFRLNDLVFPRKAAFERQPVHDEDEAATAVERRLRDLERSGFRGSLFKAVWFGIPGAFRNQPVRLRSLSDRVGMFRDVPTLLRATKFREMVDRDRLPQAFGHYFDRLAFECALAGSSRGRLVLYYEILAGDKFMVYDVAFRDLVPISAEAERRLGLLESGASPSDLPACPTWMFKSCRFKDRCGCGDAA